MARDPFTLIKSNPTSSQDNIICHMDIFFEKEWDCNIPPYSELKKYIRWDDIPLFQRIYSEVLLYCSIICPHRLPEEIPDELKKYPVFGSGTPALQELLETVGSIAVFPTISEAAESEKWRLYVFQNNEKKQWVDHSHLLEYSQFIDSCTVVYLVDKFFKKPASMLMGNSWQLAYRMAQHALEQNDTKKILAYNYLLTGAVNGNTVEKVEIGQKVLLVNDCPKRKFLYPAACDKIIEDKYKEKCQPVTTVEQAWRLISGTGIEKPSNISLPENLQYLHLLVGGAFSPVFSVILQLNPRKIILWCSEETRKNGELIRDTLQLIPEFSGEIQIMSLDSHDLQSCYEKLKDHILEQKSYSETLISITGGNRLMGIAAQLTAQVCNIKLVYRDIDAAEKNLTIIQFGKNNNYESDDLLWNKCPFDSSVNWNYLYAKKNQVPKPCTAEQLLELFYKKVSP